MRILTEKKGLSPVVASILLCAATLTVGIAAWSFTYSATKVLRSNYYEGVQKQIDAISERFTVEHIDYDSQSQTLHVWTYNYGDVDIEVDVYIRGEVEGQNATATPISHGKLVSVDVPLGAGWGDELSVTVMSRRQNFVYATYIVPYT